MKRDMLSSAYKTRGKDIHLDRTEVTKTSPWNVIFTNQDPNHPLTFFNIK